MFAFLQRRKSSPVPVLVADPSRYQESPEERRASADRLARFTAWQDRQHARRLAGIHARASHR